MVSLIEMQQLLIPNLGRQSIIILSPCCAIRDVQQKISTIGLVVSRRNNEKWEEVGLSVRVDDN